MPEQRQQIAQSLGGVSIVFDDEDSQWFPSGSSDSGPAEVQDILERIRGVF
jgi:hypothetical protein